MMEPKNERLKMILRFLFVLACLCAALAGSMMAFK